MTFHCIDFSNQGYASVSEDTAVLQTLLNGLLPHLQWLALYDNIEGSKYL